MANEDRDIFFSPQKSGNQQQGSNPFEVSNIDRVGIRVPPFWSSNPLLWFHQLESQFALNNITVDSTKYFYVTSFLDIKCLQEVEDIIQNPPATGKYEKIKEELIRRLSRSQEQRIQQLLEHEEIGDRTPSQFLRHLRNLAGDIKVPENFLRTIWMNRLPASMRTILATQMDASLEKMAELADKVNEITPIGKCAAVSTDTRFELLCEQMAGLTQQVAELAKHSSTAHPGRSTFRGRKKWRNYGRSSSRGRNNSRTSGPSQPGVCWYHRRFGDRSTRCTIPCTYPQRQQQHQGNEIDRP
ncbi:uncharacterized protein LOC143265916 [Megachile rotundata]|uniref:uncharacterized protein LOC143265916 n=1 Tax=Megachile rotundata TaxID=143995 RepID=UPI003FD1421C